MKELVLALGLAAVLEGLMISALPRAMKASWRQLMDQPDEWLRWAGIGIMLAGVGLVALERYWNGELALPF